MFYRKCPEPLEMIDLDHYKYRWNIQYNEDQCAWSCNEIVIEKPITCNNITKRVLEYLWPIDIQVKMINEYNTALEGLCDKDIQKEYCMRYRQFLVERLAVKARIHKDLFEHGIEN